MKTFVGNQFSRYFIIGLQKDDLILESIQKTVQEYGIRNAIITSGIAATYHMRWHHIKDTDVHPTDEILEHSAPMEVGGISGMVIDGVPHLHCTFADHEKAWAEHLEEGCRIQYVGEISMIELLDLDIARIPNEFGVKLISEKR
ncbi:MAG: DNA-binding protein [Blautia sp.]|nr:DNA-binding protein [Blautia sp.]